MQFLTAAMSVIMATLVMGYDEKFDKVDVDKIVNDDKVFTSYIKCLLDEGPCDAELSKEFKEVLPEIISTSCAKCTKTQRDSFRKLLRAVFEKKIDKLLDFQRKYDPNNRYEENMKKLMRE